MTGYDENFLPGHTVPMPELSAELRRDAYNNGEPIHHTRFSIVFNRERKLAFYAAYNIDGAHPLVLPREDQFKYDPNLPRYIQLHNKQGYYQSPYDRGHLARRAALVWGNDEISLRAEEESYYYSNIVPQHEKLHSTAWGDIEDWILDFAQQKENQASVFTGPVFTKHDELWKADGEAAIKIPAGFWKVLVKVVGGELKAAGFLTWQRDFSDDGASEEFVPYTEQVRISSIEFLTGLNFGDLRYRDPIRFGLEARADIQGI